jgi:hypothetical protein
MGLLEDLSPKFRRWCEAIATDQRCLLNLQAFDRLPAHVLGKRLGATILTPKELVNLEQQHIEVLLASDKWSAAVICPDPLQIVHNQRHALVRRESNLMHELGHILLKHSMSSFDSQTGLPTRSSQDENEATYLGSCLQIPCRGLLWAIQKELALSEIADHFGASKDMVRFRLNAVGIKQLTQ